MESLKQLNFSFNEITEIPNSVVGLKRITEIFGERCKLTSLPNTITYLSTLRLLDISNNKFTKFPIEISSMINLKILNLRNNEIYLLPRNINSVLQLEVLNLARNNLRALPTEFTDNLESIPTIYLEENPWYDFPPKWGKILINKKSSDSIQGYNVIEVLEFLYAMKMFYYEAEKIWELRGTFYYTQRLNFHDFLSDLKLKMSEIKYQNLSIEHIKILFFIARENGNFPKWYLLDDNTISTINTRIHNDAILREQHVQRSKDDLIQRRIDEHLAYDVDIIRRAMRTEELQEEYLVNEAILEQTSAIALRGVIQSRLETIENRQMAAEKIKYMKEMAEMRRLQGIIEDETKIRKKYDIKYDEDDI